MKNLVPTGILMYMEYMGRLTEYRENPDKIVYVKPYTAKPALLFVNSDTESGTGPDRRINDGVASWYGKEAIFELEP